MRAPAGIVYVDLDDLVAIAARIAGEASRPLIRDVGLLAAAVGRPITTVFQRDAYETLHDKAAALLHSLARNHALVDGNKRLAWVACRLFYAFNNCHLDMPEDVAYDFVISVTTGELQDVAGIAGVLSTYATGALPTKR